MAVYFDWVSARSKCSPGTVFELLDAAAKQDVESVHRLLQETRNSKLVFQHSRVGKTIVVTRERMDTKEDPTSSVTFSLSQNDIVVKKGEKEMFHVVPSLNPVGDCKMNISGEEFEVWQVCRRALEDLFFGT